MMSPLLVFSAGSALILADSSWFMLIIYAIGFAILYFKYGRTSSTSSRETAEVTEEAQPLQEKAQEVSKAPTDLPVELLDKELPQEPIEEVSPVQTRHEVQEPEELPSVTQQENLIAQEPKECVVSEEVLHSESIQDVQSQLIKDEDVSEDVVQDLQRPEEPITLQEEEEEVHPKSRSSSVSSEVEVLPEQSSANLLGSAPPQLPNENEEEEEPSTLSKVQDLLRRSSKSSASSSEDESEEKSDKKETPSPAQFVEEASRSPVEEKTESDPTSLEIVRPEDVPKLEEEAFEVKEEVSDLLESKPAPDMGECCVIVLYIATTYVSHIFCFRCRNRYRRALADLGSL